MRSRISTVLCLLTLLLLTASCAGELNVGLDVEMADDARGKNGGSAPTPTDVERVGDLKLMGDLETYSRLTKQEYRYVIADLLPAVDPAVMADMMAQVETLQENNYTGFYKNYNDISVSPGLENKQLELAKSMAAAATGSSWFEGFCAGNCFDAIVAYLPRIWRKRVSDDQIAELRTFYAQFPEDKRDYLLLVRVYASPYFNYKMYKAWPESVDEANMQRASQISFLISGSIPDEELQAAADDGSIADAEVAEAHIRRLLAKHPDRFATLFVPQWLGLASLYETDSSFDDVPLRTIMTEPALIFAEMIRQGEPVSKIIALDYNMVDGPLAELYGATAQGSGWSKQSIIPSLFGSAAFTYLTVDHETNYPSPIKRGSYIVNHLLCRNLEFPSAEAQSAVDRIVAAAPEDQSPPERMAYFRSFDACAGCHNQFDFYGLALEEMGAYGATRTDYYTGDPIEKSGQVGAISFTDSVDFSNQLAETVELNTCFASQVYSYATSVSHVETNREFTHVESALMDKPVDEIVAKMMMTALGESL